MGGAMSSIVVSGDTSGAVTLSVPAVAGTNTVTIAAQTGTLNAAGPTFSATSNAAQTITSNTFTLVSLQTKNWDTATAFNNTGSTATLNGISVPAYAFAPNVAGYYQVNYSIDSGSASTAPTRALPSLYKNAANYRNASNIIGANVFSGMGSSMVYLNGTSDYIQMYALITATTAIITNTSAQTFFEAVLVRGA
jgi:hypothetical protein